MSEMQWNHLGKFTGALRRATTWFDEIERLARQELDLENYDSDEMGDVLTACMSSIRPDRENWGFSICLDEPNLNGFFGGKCLWWAGPAEYRDVIVTIEVDFHQDKDELKLSFSQANGPPVEECLAMEPIATLLAPFIGRVPLDEETSISREDGLRYAESLMKALAHFDEHRYVPARPY